MNVLQFIIFIKNAIHPISYSHHMIFKTCFKIRYIISRWLPSEIVQQTRYETEIHCNGHKVCLQIKTPVQDIVTFAYKKKYLVLRVTLNFYTQTHCEVFCMLYN